MINENINNQILFMIIYINKCITNTVSIADYLSNGKLVGVNLTLKNTSTKFIDGVYWI